MRLTMIDFVEPGSVLGKTIHDSDGRPLLKHGTSLSSSYIKRLTKLGYTAIYINDPLTYDIVVQDYVPKEIRHEIIGGIRQSFEELRNGNTVSRLLTDKTANRITDLFKSMVDSLNGNELFSLYMGSILNKDEALYSHSFHVGLYSTIIAIAKKLDRTRVQEIGIGALLHDIGKVALPDQILDKPGKLTAEEWVLVKSHPTVGYDIIRKQHTFSVVSAHCAYQHHEKLDGTGYPRGLRDERIHEVGRITAVADVFEAMTAARPYKKPILPGVVMEYLYANCGTHFDHQYVELFRDNIALYPVGITVTLNDERKGVVVKNHLHETSRPTVRIFAHGKESISPYDVDLSTSRNMTVIGVDKDAPLDMSIEIY